MAAFHFVKDIFSGLDVGPQWEFQIQNEFKQAFTFMPDNLKPIHLQETEIFNSV